MAGSSLVPRCRIHRPARAVPLYQWAATLATASALQLYDLRPVAITQRQGSACTFANLSSLLASATTPAAVVSGANVFTLDRGTESAAWAEVNDAPDPLDALR